MDIRRWLVETVEQSDEDSHHRRESHHQHKNDSFHHKRSATPIAKVPVEASPRHERDQHKERRHKRKISEARSASAATFSSSDSCTTSDSSSSSSALSEHFERRQRHKTRKDLYEPHSGVRKKRTKQDDKSEAKSKKRKKKKEEEHRRTETKKRGVKRPGQDFHENFTAKNVRDDRLTLKPQPMLGLLKKRRASSPTKPRGLPDLVFSEMQFLKKPRPSIEQSGHSEEMTKSEKERGKKNNKVEEEEVSAYFGSTRPPAHKEHNDTSRCTTTPATTSSKPGSAAVQQKERAHDIPARRVAMVEDPRRTQSESPRHILRSRTSNISTVRATSSTAPLSNVAAEASQVPQAKPNADLNPDTAMSGQTKPSVTMQAAGPKTTIENMNAEKPLRHDNDALQKKPSENNSADETSKTMDAQTVTTRVGPAAPIDPVARSHDSPMAKLLQACQTSVHGAPARSHSHSNDDHPGMESFMARQPKYTAEDGVVLVNYRVHDQPGNKGFWSAQPKCTDQDAILVPTFRADDHPDMRVIEYRQPKYRSGETVMLGRTDNVKAIQHAQPYYTVQDSVSMATHRHDMDLMQEPRNGFITDSENHKGYTTRASDIPSRYARYQDAKHDHQRHRLNRQQQQHHHDRQQDEYAVMEAQGQYASAAPMYTSYSPHAGVQYQDHYLPHGPCYEQAQEVNQQVPQHYNTHDEQYHYPPQPNHDEGIYYEDYGNTGPQDVEVYQDYDAGYIVQEQNMYVPQQYEIPHYGMRDAVDVEMEQQIAEEEMIGVEQEGFQTEENGESENFVPASFWRSRKRRRDDLRRCVANG